MRRAFPLPKGHVCLLPNCERVFVHILWLAAPVQRRIIFRLFGDKCRVVGFAALGTTLKVHFWLQWQLLDCCIVLCLFLAEIDSLREICHSWTSTRYRCKHSCTLTPRTYMLALRSYFVRQWSLPFLARERPVQGMGKGFQCSMSASYCYEQQMLGVGCYLE